jgi:GntR family transcriptional regulator
MPRSVTGEVPAPLYSRIRENLRGKILRGVYQPHDRMPSESELMTEYGVSRITVRQALGELEKESIIFRIPGRALSCRSPSRSSRWAGYRASPRRWRRWGTRPSTAW